MKMYQRGIRIGCLSGMLLLAAGSALASEAAGHGGGQFKDFLYRLLDFGITFGVLYFVLRGPLKRTLETRRQRVAGQLEKARQLQAGAERRYEACRQQLADADTRIAQLTEDLKAESALQCRRIEEQARKMADDIRSEAQRSAAREVEAARKQLHQEAVRLAMELAEARLKQQMVPADQTRLVDEYLRKTGE